MKEPRKEPQNRLSLRPEAPDAEEPQDYGKMLVTGLSSGRETKPTAGGASNARKNAARKNARRKAWADQEITDGSVYRLPTPMPPAPWKGIAREEFMDLYASRLEELHQEGPQQEESREEPRQEEENQRAHLGPTLIPFADLVSSETPASHIDDPASSVLCCDQVPRKEEGGNDSGTTNEEADAREGVRMAKTKNRPGKKDETIGIIQLTEMIPDEKAAIKFLEELRWGDQLFCPRCGSTRVARSPSNKSMSHRCYRCKKPFSVKTGSVMARTQLPLRKWIMAIHLLLTGRKGMSSVQIAKHLSITQKSTWHLMHRIREGMQFDGELLEGEVEADETYFGPKENRMHANKRHKTPEEAWAAKQAVMGIKERGGRLAIFPIDATDTETLEGLIQAYVSKDADAVYTDGHPGYRNLNDLGYHHWSVNHRRGEYVAGPAGEIHTQSIESSWSLMKRAHMGVYHRWSKKHLHRYCDEFAFRESVGVGNSIEAIAVVFERMLGKDLPHKKLIDEETSVEDRKRRMRGNRQNNGGPFVTVADGITPDGVYIRRNEDGTTDYI